jgi:LysR family transcriptional regulator, transcriptional activator of the cysJI operon
VPEGLLWIHTVIRGDPPGEAALVSREGKKWGHLSQSLVALTNRIHYPFARGPALMQIDTLKIFMDLVETESFTKAAQINKITQSAVSQQISSLERLFKARLVERSKRQFRLTREGQIFYDYARQISQTFETLQSKMQEIKHILSGNIQVATVYSIGLHELPPYVRQFLKAHPNVNVHVAYRRSNQVYEDVLGNLADLGLVVFPQKTGHLEMIPLHKEDMALICHPEHPLAQKKRIKPKDLAGQKFVSFEGDMPTRRATDKVLREHGIRVQQVMEFDNVETIKRAVEIDAGLAIVPQSTVRLEVAKHTLVAVPFEGLDLERPWAVIYKQNKVLSPAMKQFITVLKGAPPA